MNQDAFNLFSSVISIITLVITIIGLYAVYFQIRKLTETTWSNTHSKLADQSFELLKFMADYPDTYDYFYKKKLLDDKSDNRTIVLYIAEALANFMEHLVLQKENLPEKQWEVWERFIYTTFKTSIVVRNFVQENREWYSSDLLVIADKSKVLY
jgi:hypothetical protein